MKMTFKLLLMLNLALTLHSCIDDSDTYRQLNADDLNHLYFDRNSVVCEEKDIEYTDSVVFLVHARETIIVAAKTRIWSTIDEPLALGYYNANGQSTINFEKSTGFDYAQIRVFREFNTYPSVKNV